MEGSLWTKDTVKRRLGGILVKKCHRMSFHKNKQKRLIFRNRINYLLNLFIKVNYDIKNRKTITFLFSEESPRVGKARNELQLEEALKKSPQPL